MNTLYAPFFPKFRDLRTGLSTEDGECKFLCHGLHDKKLRWILSFLNKRPLQTTSSKLFEGNGADDGMLGLKVCTRHRPNTSQIETACTSVLMPELCSAAWRFSVASSPRLFEMGASGVVQAWWISTSRGGWGSGPPTSRSLRPWPILPYLLGLDRRMLLAAPRQALP